MTVHSDFSEAVPGAKWLVLSVVKETGMESFNHPVDHKDSSGLSIMWQRIVLFWNGNHFMLSYSHFNCEK